MFNSYRDIIDAVGREPIWWDEHGVPRFVPFRPELTANWMADEVALLLVKCQSCLTEFRMCASARQGHMWGDSRAQKPKTLADRIIARGTLIGDPPNSGCCNVGPFTSAVELKVLEYWRAGRPMERQHQYEMDIAPEHMWEADRFAQGFGPISKGWRVFEAYRAAVGSDRDAQDGLELETEEAVAKTGFKLVAQYSKLIVEEALWVEIYRRNEDFAVMVSVEPDDASLQLPTRRGGVNATSWVNGSARDWLLSPLPATTLEPLAAALRSGIDA